MDIEQESKIVRRVLSGQHDAYALLVEKYKGPVYNLVIRLTGRTQDAEDLAQEIFIKVFESLGRFDQTRKFFPWLYTIALNVIRNYRKKNTPVSIHSFEDSDHFEKGTSSLSPDIITGRKQQADMLYGCIQDLPETQQEAIVLRYFQDLSFEDIAQIQEISLSAAKMRVYRGLRVLAERMKDAQ